MNRLLAVALAGILFFPAVPVAATAADDPPATAAVDVTITRINDTAVAYHYDFTIPASVDAYRVRLYTGAATEYRGFTVETPPRLLTWNGTREASITAIQRVSDRAESDCLCVATERSTVVQPIRVELQAERDGTVTKRHLTDWFGGPSADATFTVDEGRFTPGVVYLGPTTVETATVDGQRLRVLGPADSPQRSAERVLQTIERTAGSVDFTRGADPSATIGIVPGDGELGARGVTWSNGYAFVDASTGPSVWIHEYVHTQERYTTAASMEWFTEATASYYGHSIAARQSGSTAAAVARHYTTLDTEAGTLADPSTWSSHHLPYRKGARVVAYLDWRIRTATDGRATFLDVYRRLNGRSDLTVADLDAAVASVVGDRSLAGEIDRLVTTPDSVGTEWGTTPASDGSQGAAASGDSRVTLEVAGDRVDADHSVDADGDHPVPARNEQRRPSEDSDSDRQLSAWLGVDRLKPLASAGLLGLVLAVIRYKKRA